MRHRNVLLQVLVLSLVLSLTLVPAALGISATCSMNGSQHTAVKSAAIGPKTSVQWKGYLDSRSSGNCYFDLKYGSTSAATATFKTYNKAPGSSFGYETNSTASASYWAAQMNTPNLSSGRIGSSTVYIP